MIWSNWNHMSIQEQADLTKKKFEEYMLGNSDAVKFLIDIFTVAHIWDDLIDKDKPLSDYQINQSYWISLIEIPRNPFFLKNSFHLTSLFEAFANQWFDANEMHYGEKEDTRYSFVLKDTLMDMVAHCAKIVGGFEHMRKVSMEIRELTEIHQTFQQYRSEVEQCQIQSQELSQ